MEADETFEIPDGYITTAGDDTNAAFVTFTYVGHGPVQAIALFDTRNIIGYH